MIQNSTRFSEFWTNTKNKVVGWLSDSGSAEAMIARARQFEGNLALQYYESRAPKPLKIDARTNIDDNLQVGYAEMIVEKGVDFLFGDGLAIEIDNEDADKRLNELWPQEARDEDLIDLATDGGVFGDAWLKIYLDESGRPGVLILDPSIWQKITSPDNYKQIEIYRCQYKKGERWFREDTSREGSGWVSQAFESVDGKTFYATEPPIVWPFPAAPILTCKNLPASKSPYGKADLSRAVIELCRYLHRVDSLIGKIVRVHSSPKAVAKGVAQQDLAIGVDSTLFLKSAEASIELLEMSGDLAGALAFRKMCREALSEISKIPEIATGKLESVGQLSGRAMQILYGPLIKKTLTKRRFYGPLIQAAIRTLLTVDKFPGAADLEVSLMWPSPVPPDKREEGEIGLIYKEIGFSRKTIITTLGFDADAELAQRAAEDREAAEAGASQFNAGAVPGAELYQ